MIELPPYTCYTCRIHGIIRQIGGKDYCRCPSKGMTQIGEVCSAWASPNPQDALQAMEYAQPSSPIDWRHKAW